MSPRAALSAPTLVTTTATATHPAPHPASVSATAPANVSDSEACKRARSGNRVEYRNGTSKRTPPDTETSLGAVAAAHPATTRPPGPANETGSGSGVCGKGGGFRGGVRGGKRHEVRLRFPGRGSLRAV